MYTTSAIDSTTRTESRTPVQRRASSGSLTDSECSSSSLETPISYATDPEHPNEAPARTTRQKVDRRPPSTFVSEVAISSQKAIRTNLNCSSRSTVPQEEIRDVMGRVPLRSRNLSCRAARVEGRINRSRSSRRSSCLEGTRFHPQQRASTSRHSAARLLGSTEYVL